MFFVFDLVARLLTNIPFVAAMISLLLSQTIKVVYYYFVEKKLDLRHFIEASGLPSSHSAMVTALTITVGFINGFTSSFFAICVVLSIIVMYDAMGVRLAAGKQAFAINKIIEEIYEDKISEKERLKELIGHTPVEVVAGGFLGLFVGLFVYFLIF
jgi:acid phosphatase family membrane protein YuiD